MVPLVQESRGEMIEAAVEAVVEQQLVPAEDLRGFLSRYFRDVAGEDLRAWDPADIAGCGLCHHQLAARRLTGTANVRAYLPTVDEHGWSTGHTVVEIVNDDMPFLVDSVTAELTRQGRGIHLVIHPVFVVRRDDHGDLLEVLESSSSTVAAGETRPSRPAGTRLESWMHIEIDRETDAAEIAALTSSLHGVLDDVRAAVEDWPAMRTAALTLARELRERPPEGLEDQAAGAGRLLDWLADENFTFLGYREYELADAAGEEVLRAVPGSGLGILRPEAKQDSESFNRLPARARAKARERRVLVLTKANSRATVHRPAYLDYVGVKSFDASGRVVGERRFLGLYSSAAYLESVRRVPILDEKVDAVLARSGFAPDSHSGKDLLAILETYPRDELFQVDVEELYETVLAVLRLQERRRPRLFLRREVYGRYMSALVFLPRDRYTTAVRLRMERILKEAFGAESIDHTARVSESVLARLHFVVRVPSGQEVPDVDERQLEGRLVAATRTWEEDLAESLHAEVSEEVASRLLNLWGGAFPEAYKEDFPARVAVGDVRRIDRLAADTRARAAAGDASAVERAFATNLYQPLDADPQVRRFKLFRCAPLSLTAVLPFFRNLGVEVVDERPYHLRRKDGTSAWIYDFGLRFPEEVAADAPHATFTEAFLAAWEGRSESDGLDQLVLRAGLTWRQVVILRAYTKYLRQAGSTFSQTYVESCLAANVPITRLLVRLFEARFRPGGPQAGPDSADRDDAVTGSVSPGRAEAVAGLADEIRGALDDVASLDHDRILRWFLAVISATLRTNFYQRDESGEPKPYASFKLNPSRLPELPEPRPTFEIWVYAPTVEGVHLRFGAVARGGLRWSDRREDFRTEVLGLVKAQTVKNAVIVPTGAKGGFVGKALPDPGVDRDAWLAEGVRCYQTFIRGLLDVTDNLVADESAPGGRRVQPPPLVVRHDNDDPYLVVAADKGTASFSDIANAVSAEYGFWLRDAFASGGSAGYDHKAMGITARGAWESVKRHFRELGVDTQTQDFSVAGIGDMSGDVFGNGMLLSEHIRLVAAFDHRHIFLDPDPDAAASFAERRRLFGLPRSSWADYDPALISPGGGVYPRTAKSVPITPQVAAVLGLPDGTGHLTPAELMTAILTAPVDLLWNGGIGTYVKSSTESHAEVGDKANDAIRVDGARLRTRVVGEGGNLGLTQRGRIEAARSGVRLNTDAIDNSAGVDCSDHEVNIKILLDGVVAEGGLTGEQRDRLLEQMTDEVARLVLLNNYEQNVLLGNARGRASLMLHVHHHFVRALEADGVLDRALEFLPTDAEFAARRERQQGLTSPELAVLVAYSKMTVARRLLDTPLPDEPWFRRLLHDYFPRPLVEQYGDRLDSHPLAREIVTTCLVNDMVNRGGITFATRAAQDTGASIEHVARAYAVCSEIFSQREYVAAVEALDHLVEVDVQTTMYQEFRRLLDRSVRWFLRNIRDDFDVAAEVERFSPVVRRWCGRMDELLVGSEHARSGRRAQEMVSHGVPQELATRYATLLDEFALLGITETALRDTTDAAEVARLYFYLSERYDAHTILERISQLERPDRWQALARGAMRDDLYATLEALTRSVLAFSADGSVHDRTAAWERQNAGQLTRTRQTIEAMASLENVELAPLTVVLRSLRSVVRAGSD